MRRLRGLLLGGAVGLSGLLGFGAPAAHADFIPTLVAVTPDGGGDFIYTYDVLLTGGEAATPGGAPVLDGGGVQVPGNIGVSGSFFTIYDFQGLVSGSETISPLSGQWTAEELALGATPPQVVPVPPDGSFTNLTFYLSGAPPVPGSVLFTVTAKSTIGLVSLGAYTSEAADTLTPGKFDQAVGNTFVPNPSGGPLPTPLPASALSGLGLLGLLAGKKLTSRKA